MHADGPWLLAIRAMYGDLAMRTCGLEIPRPAEANAGSRNDALRPRAPCAIERQVKSFFVRRYPMADERHSGITMHKLSFGGGLMGLLFATGCVLIFLLGFPALWYFVAFAFALGLGVALFLRSASDRLSQRNKPMSLFAASDQRIDTPARRKRRIRWHRLPRVATA